MGFTVVLSLYFDDHAWIKNSGNHFPVINKKAKFYSGRKIIRKIVQESFFGSSHKNRYSTTVFLISKIKTSRWKKLVKQVSKSFCCLYKGSYLFGVLFFFCLNGFFIYNLLLNHSNPVKQVLYYCPHHTNEETETECLSNSSKITQLVSGKAEIHMKIYITIKTKFLTILVYFPNICGI